MNKPEKENSNYVFKNNDVKTIDEINEAFFRPKIRFNGYHKILNRMSAGTLVVFMLISMLFSGVAGSILAKPDYRKIFKFEKVNSVYSSQVDNGTAQSKLELPKTLRAVVELETFETTDITMPEPSTPIGTPESTAEAGTDSSDYDEGGQTGFKQTLPKVNTEGDYDYYRYGYVAPRNENKLRKAEKPVIYTVYYADENKEYRVYGTWDGINEGFYACDENGDVFGAVKDVPVTWACNAYKAKTAGTYTFKAKIDNAYTYDGEMPTAEISVKDEGREAAEHDHDCSEDEVLGCTCGTTTDKHKKDCVLYTPECTCGRADNGHLKGCPLWNPKCTCPKGTSGHTDKGCPYYVPLADCDCGIDAGSRPWEHKKGCKYYSNPVCTCEGGVHDPKNTDCLKYVAIQQRSINGGGANDVAGDNEMKNFAKTTGNAGYTSLYTSGFTVPGFWVDYINTIWMNKAYNKFAWTPTTSTGARNNWAWGGGTAATAANGTVITTQNTAGCIPAASGGIWTIYSGEQLRYALTNFVTGQTISLGSNINLDGNNRNWAGIDLTGKATLTINGNGYTIFNLGSTLPVSGSAVTGGASFITRFTNLTVSNLNFASAKLVAPSSNDIGVFGLTIDSTSAIRNFTDIEVSKSLVFGKDICSIMGDVANGNGGAGGGTCSVTRCFTSSSYIYGGDHITGFINRGTNLSVNYCGSFDNLMCGYGGHSSGFLSCATFGPITVNNSFTANEIYGSVAVSGFMGVVEGTYTDCYSTGKLEGYSILGGFGFNQGQAQKFQRCYSTTLVGLRKMSPGMTLGGFISTSSSGSVAMSNCYAAGETGNYDTDLNAPSTVGGYISGNFANTSYSNCYYDKQMTAMREWAAGNTKTLNGVTGCLTSDTTKGGTGLAGVKTGQQPPALNSSNSGFKGFSDNTKWVYTDEHYPQLTIFADASSAAAAWGSAARANTVKAWSLASAATVFLATWDEGYDWDGEGVRTATEVSYKRDVGSTLHKGNQYTYDTVREIVSDFKVTNIAANATTWTQLIPGGAPVLITDGVTDTKVTGTVEIAGGKGTVHNPGMDWYKTEETVSGQSAYRPLRLFAYMKIDAGADKNVAAGELYNHRSEVKLTMMDTITDNLVVGLKPSELPDIGKWPSGSDQTPHNSRIWSTAKTGKYPDSTGYYAVPTTNMETGFSASQNAWIDTEIWRAQKDATGNYVKDGDGNFVPEYSVKVTGTGTGSNLTIDERKWNGQEPLYADTSVGHKYIVTYYWMLSDGRYRTDYKIITIEPGHYDLTVDVFNLSGQTANSTALYTGAEPDSGPNPDYHYSANPTAHAEALNNRYTTNVTAAWKKQAANTQIAKMQVTMKAADKTTVMGTAAITGNISEGSQITIPVTYLYITTVDDEVQGKREVTASQAVNITYTVQKDADGGYYLRFNKLANEPANEVPSAYAYGDRTGIPENTKAYINDLTYNVSVELWVIEAGALSVQKILSSPAEEEEQFVFQIDYCGSGSAAGAAERTMYAVITIPAGETKGTALFKDMPMGWYTVSELESNWRFKLLSSQLKEDNPHAIIDQVNAKVTMWIESNHGNYIYRNKRQDIPWVNGKANVTNHMPQLVKEVG